MSRENDRRNDGLSYQKSFRVATTAFSGAKQLFSVIVHLGNREQSFLILLIHFLLTVTAATLIFISGRGSAISCAKEGKSGFIYNWLGPKITLCPSNWSIVNKLFVPRKRACIP